MKVLLAHPGTQHAFRLARELYRQDLLGEFWTSLALAETGVIGRLAGAVTGHLRNRIIPEVPDSLLHSRPLHELRALVRLRSGGNGPSVLHERNAAFQHAIPFRGLQRNDAIIAFDTSGWILARRARDAGKPFFLDRTIAHPATLQRSMAQLGRAYPEWQVDLTPRPMAVVEAEDEEHARANRIVVGSSFARTTLIDAGVAEAKIHVNPYGVDWARFARLQQVNATTAPEARPLRFLFAGAVVARKGVPVLLDAWRALAPKNAELWIAGSVEPGVRHLIPVLPGLRLLGRVPNSEMPRIYAETDVLVLPSLMEGFSLVLLEALAAGLRIIATPNTGAGDFLTSPILGELIETGSVDALKDALQRELVTAPNRKAIQTATVGLADRYSWSAYGARWSTILRKPL